MSKRGHGGARENSGGARPGSGPKKRLPKDSKAGIEDPLEYLRRVIADPTEAPALRVRAAVTLAQYTNSKSHDGGKKEQRDAAAERAGTGRFAPSAPPKLVVNNR